MIKTVHVVAALATLCSCWLGSCRSAAAEGDPGTISAITSGPVLLGEAELVGVFGALMAAIEEHADDEARRIVARLELLELDQRTRRRLDSFAKVLFGRQLTGDTSLRLEGRLADGHVALQVVVQAPAVDCVLRPGSPAVHLQWTTIFPTGEEERLVTTLRAPRLEAIELRAGTTQTVSLGGFALPIGRALASRMRFDLRLGGGQIEAGGELYPAMHYVVEPCEIVRLAGFLPSSTVDPEELVRYVRGESLRTEALVERAVRIAPARKREALDLLTPVALELDRVRLESIVPALRWLSGNVRFGADSEAWRAWFQARAAELSIAPRPELDLPTEAWSQDS